MIKIPLSKNENGFTLMEVLVVVIIVALLAQLAVSSYRKTVREARKDEAKARLEQVAQAYQRFRIEHPGYPFLYGELPNTATDSLTCNYRTATTVGNPHGNNLYGCGYLEPAKRGTDLGTFYVCGGGTGGDASKKRPACCGAESTGILACVRKADEYGFAYSPTDGIIEVASK
ncbi:prepilin-type N-terminal cleavage/methylation domain-containing protein [Parelusimicrobium proximum]|uniref:type IV pilin protein n=1 Tax=Parelusimicrobium proximum TaxID=3228953 RepID=UPI003D162709